MTVAAITKRAVDAATPGARDLFIWDRELSGFGLKITPAGGKVYLVQYRTGGRGSPTKRVTIGKHGAPWTPEQARREARRILGEVAGGRDPAAQKAVVRRQRAPENAVASVVEEWLRRDQAKNRTADEVRRVMAREVLPAWGDRPITEIRKRDVLQLIDGIADRGSPIQANRALAYVRRLFNWAAGRDIIEANPAQFVERPARESKRERWLDDEELAAVWRAADGCAPPFRDGLRLLILTGARRDEIFGLRWSEIDFEAAAIRLPAERSKTGEGRTIPLSAPALDILKRAPRIAGDLVLTLNGKTAYSAFSNGKRAVDSRAPELPEWRLHDLRRSLATGMQRLGVRLEVIEAVLGHVSGSRAGIVGVYQRHRFEAETRAALDAWAAHLERVLSGASASVVPLRKVKR